jgi:putative transposase
LGEKTSEPTEKKFALKHSLTPERQDNVRAASSLGIVPAHPRVAWENGYCESFNGKLRDELLNGEIFYTLREAQVLIEQWRRHYNTHRPHSALNYRPPAPEAILPKAA